MRPAVRVRRLGAEDAPAYAHIALPEDQEVFGGKPGAAFDDLPETMDLYGIEGERPLGLFRIDRAYDQHDFAQAGEVGLRYFIVDHAEQGRGVAGAALAALPEMLRRDYPNAPSIALTVNCRNPGAYRAYERAGFTDTGELYLHGGAGPQHVMRMALS